MMDSHNQTTQDSFKSQLICLPGISLTCFMTDKLFYTVQFNNLHFCTAHATCFNVFNFKEKGHFCIVLLNLYSFISHPLLFSVF